MEKSPDLLDQPIWLEAVSKERNIARRYTIEPSRDLFGAIIVDYAWGRIGTRGQARTVSFEDEGEARRFVQARIKDRLSAPKRIGIGYQHIDACGRPLRNLSAVDQSHF